MQLRLSLATAALLVSIASQAQDYVTFQYLQYDENDDRTSVSAPSIMINKDFGTDYTLNASFVFDAVSGASPTYYVDTDAQSSASIDTSSGGSAFARAIDANASDVKYGNVEYDDTRKAFGLLFTTRFENRDELNIGGNYSTEHDFYSTEGSAEYMHYLGDSKNQSVAFGMSYQYNEILVWCIENEGCTDANSGASETMTASTLNAQLSFSQTIDSDSYAKVALFAIKEDGYLTNPYMNVVRNYDEATDTADVVAENRPDLKMAYGTSVKYANALTSDVALQLSYRYYHDDWDINSHTLEGDIYYEYGSDWIFKLGLRGYTQSEADFYSANKDYFTDEEYASSDQRMSAFNTITYKTNIDYKISDDWRVNISANYYDISTGNNALYFMSGFRYNF